MLIRKIVLSLFILTLISLPLIAVAQTPPPESQGQTKKAAEAAGYDLSFGDETGLARVVGAIVRVFLSILGVLFICYAIYGGYTWMMAAGNDENVNKAKAIIRNAIIGLIVTLASFSIYLVINQFLIGSQTAPGA